MPRFFFHVHDGTSIRDDEGTDLPDIFAAQEEAIRLSGALLGEMGGKFWNGTEWSLEVTDEAGRLLFTLRFVAEEGPDLAAP
jgi:hypothetical protein